MEGDTNLEMTAGTIATATTIGLNVKASAFNGDLTVTGSAGVDYILGGKGHNILTGGAGVDTIDLSASKAVHDAVGLTGIVAAANGDVIKGFEVGAAATADTVFLNAPAALTGSGVTLNAVAEGGKLKLDSAAAATTVNELSVDIGADAKTAAGILNHIDDTASDTYKGHLIVYGEGNAYLYYVDETDSNQKIDSGELHLIGTFEGIAAGGFENGNVVW